MRIIDKNTDFYDYLQIVYRDNTITFDRTDSFVLSKEDVCSAMYTHRHLDGKWEFFLLQVNNTFWLFLLEITKFADKSSDKPIEYTVDLISSWKNYNKPRVLINLNMVAFGWETYRMLRDKIDYPWKYTKASIMKNSKVLVDAINMDTIDYIRNLNTCTLFVGNHDRIEKHIPLLKASGLPICIDPLDIYLSFEEYFSLAKSALERTESVGITDKERIENHGFDTKVSFRNTKPKM